MAGYSATPLIKKLGIKPEMRAIVRFPPKGNEAYWAHLGAGARDARWVVRAVGEMDFIHGFFYRRARLRKQLKTDLGKLRQNGMFWVSWPKKSSGVATDITEDSVRAEALPLGLVDIKVCAWDTTWSCLKLVIRRELRT